MDTKKLTDKEPQTLPHARLIIDALRAEYRDLNTAYHDLASDSIKQIEELKRTIRCYERGLMP